MDSPKQSKQTTYNIRESLAKSKAPIKKLRVLSLNPSISSWVQDAYRLVTLYYRMVHHQAVCPRLISLFSRWSQYLLYYREAYGFGEYKGLMVERSNPIQRAQWLVRALSDIADLKSGKDIWGLEITGF